MATGAGGVVDNQVGELEVDGFRWAQRQAEAAAVAHIESDHSHFGRVRWSQHGRRLADRYRGVKHQPCLELRFLLG